MAWVYSRFDVRNCFACMFTKSVFHLPKNSGNSGRVVNGTRLFGSFHWKFSEINGIPEKVVPFSRWKLPNGKFVFHLQIYISNFRLYCCSKKIQMLRKKVKLLLEQLQVCIFTEIVFGVRCTLRGG